MQFHGWSVRLFAILAVVVASTSGCQNMNHAQKGAATGAGLGGILGAVIGHQSGNKELGALIGAGTGAVAGGLVGDAQDARDERDAATARVHYERQARNAVTDREVVNWSRQGMSDAIIIGAISERGGRFQRPTNLGYLTESGVSEAVISVIQRYNSTQY